MDINNRDTECVRNINTSKILHTLRLSRRLMTRPEIADEVNLSKVTVANILVDLTSKQGLVRYAGVGAPDKRGGRRPRLVELDPSRKRLMGAVIGQQFMALTISDITGRELQVLRSHVGGQDRVALLLQMVENILSAIDTSRENIFGLVVAINSFDNEFGGNEESKHNPQSLTEALGFGVQVINLPQARAFGEIWHSQSEELNLFYLNLGVELVGIPVRRGFMEVGTCNFGSCYLRPQPYGNDQEKLITFEEALEPKNFIKRASILYKRPVIDQELNILASQGDKIASELFREYGYNLGCALSLVTHLGCLQPIVMGGYFTRGWPHFKDDLHRALDLHLSPALSGSIKIRLLRQEQVSGLRGALALALNHWIYHTELLNDQMAEAHGGFMGKHGFMERRP